MDDLKSILEKLMATHAGFKEASRRNAVFDYWEKAVGAKIARHAWPLKMLEGGVLLVGTENSSWSQHLKFLEPQLLVKLHQAMGKRTITGMRFCVSSRSAAMTSPDSTA
jgi:predicted nucleic acid-binding Zn ribbon protein